MSTSEKRSTRKPRSAATKPAPLETSSSRQPAGTLSRRSLSRSPDSATRTIQNSYKPTSTGSNAHFPTSTPNKASPDAGGAPPLPKKSSQLWRRDNPELFERLDAQRRSNAGKPGDPGGGAGVFLKKPIVTPQELKNEPGAYSAVAFKTDMGLPGRVVGAAAGNPPTHVQSAIGTRKPFAIDNTTVDSGYGVWYSKDWDSKNQKKSSGIKFGTRPRDPPNNMNTFLAESPHGDTNMTVGQMTDKVNSLWEKNLFKSENYRVLQGPNCHDLNEHLGAKMHSQGKPPQNFNKAGELAMRVVSPFYGKQSFPEDFSLSAEADKKTQATAAEARRRRQALPHEVMPGSWDRK